MKKYPRVKQKDITDCGAACLASVANYYGLELNISKIRQFAGTDRSGTTILGLVEASEKLGFQAKGAKGSLENLPKIPLPAIAHVVLDDGLHHFVVIYKIKKNKITFMDPADAKPQIQTLKEFEKIWTNTVVLLLPGNEFIKGKQTVSGVKRFWLLISPHRGMMSQALIGAIVYTMLGLTNSIYIQKIIDYVLVDNNIRLLNILSIGMILILLIQVLLGLIKSIITFRTGQHIDARLILGYYKHLLQLPQQFFDTMRVGEIISRVNDAVKIRIFINDVASNIVVNVLIIIFSFVIMFIYYWKLALIMMCIVPFYILIYELSNRVNKKWQRVLMENTAHLETQFVESINAVGTIKKFGIEAYTNYKTESKFIQLIQSIYLSGLKGLYLGTAAEFVTRLFTIIVLWIGSYFVISRELSPGELLSFYALIGYFTGPAASLITANKSTQDALIAADRLFEIIDLETEEVIENKIDLTPALVGNIEFVDVHFNYSNRARIFEGLNFEIEYRQMTAIVGESGSGKSSIISLILNLYPLKKGRINIGNIDIKYASNSSLRGLVSIVPQQIDLFNGTIVENIALGEFEPDLQKIIFLCKLLGINDFIEKLPDSYFAAISEHGVNLSGGQRQRIAIARALYKNPEILILDEAASSLDAISEQKLLEALIWFKSQNKTIIIIAHRLSTIRNCKEIIVLKDGYLVEKGSHEKLMGLNGAYFNMWADYAKQV